MEHRLIGNTGLRIPPLIFGTSSLGNLYSALSDEIKTGIIKECIDNVPGPVVFDSAGKYGAGLALEKTGEILGNLGVNPCNVIISNEVLIKVSYACICGSDQHVFLGEFHPRTSLPLIQGHEFAGRIVETGPDVRSFKPGDCVAVDPIIWCGHCPACKRHHYPACSTLRLVGIDLDGGFSEYMKVPETMLYKVTDNIPDKHAALVEVLSIGFHACNRAGVKDGDRVVIWGAGKVGQSILQALKTKTTNTVIMVDIIDERLEIARKAYGDVHIINAASSDAIVRIKELTDGEGVDIAFEAVGHAKELPGVLNPVRGCIQAIRGAGTVCVLGLSSEPSPVVMKELIWKEGVIMTSRVSHGEFAETIQNMNLGKLRPDAIVTDVMHPSGAQEAFEMLEKEPEKHLKILLDFNL